MTEEQFGPALPIVKYATIDEAVQMANGLEVGLGASVWSSDLTKARAVAARIEAGTVWINKHGAVDPRVPFGGTKQSGYGLEFGVEGLKHLALPKSSMAEPSLAAIRSIPGHDKLPRMDTDQLASAGSQGKPRRNLPVPSVAPATRRSGGNYSRSATL